MSDELQLTVDVLGPDRAEGSATRFGFTLGWLATWGGTEWLVEIPSGHSLGPDGKGAFEIVTDDDWRRFVEAIRREIPSRRHRRVAG